eukprot:INCI12211.1.p1 GENE.INCI12211.1~~INCI12211.1.p1  ORF type:complete len:833 (+),score=130.72 INCI12211.1:278-2776(+)
MPVAGARGNSNSGTGGTGGPAFWKPGLAAPFLDRATEKEGGGAPTYNPHAHLSYERQRRALPVFEYRQHILHAVEKYRTVILLGETGSGKSTQIPQYLHEAGWTSSGYMVGVTQPRRVAAVSLAARVADECHGVLGQTVGYMVRFDHKMDVAKTRILYMTDGTLLREFLVDPLLSRYSVIVVDEAHERNLNTDILLGLLKKVQRRRPELRLIVTSATLDARQFYQFFAGDRANKEIRSREKKLKQKQQPHNAAAVFPYDAQLSDEAIILAVQGRQYSVDTLYLEEPCADYLKKAVDTVLQIHAKERHGAILVFMPGMEEVESVCRAIKALAPTPGSSRHRSGGSGSSGSRSSASEEPLEVMPLHGSLPTHVQMRVFQKPRRGHRRVVVATNIAETSITLDRVKYVVDCCFHKLPVFNPLTGMDSLVTQPVSKATAIQRAGRAGRVAPGKCFRLCTADTFATLAERNIPEMQRTSLTWVVLQLKALGIRDVAHFDFLAPPPASTLVRALELLFALGAIDEHAELTAPTGSAMAEMPCEPMLSKMLLCSYDMGCSVEAATLAAMLSVQGVFANPPRSGSGSAGGVSERRREYEGVLKELCSKEGDHVTLVQVFNQFVESGKDPEWCETHFVKRRVLMRAAEVRKQYWRYLQRFRPLDGDGQPQELQSCEEDTESLRKCVVAGYFAHAARLHSSGDYVTAKDGRHVALHPSSSLYKLSQVPPWVVYHDCVLTSQEFIREASVINPLWLTELAPHFYQLQDHVSANREASERLQLRHRKRKVAEQASAAGGKGKWGASAGSSGLHAALAGRSRSSGSGSGSGRATQGIEETLKSMF